MIISALLLRYASIYISFAAHSFAATHAKRTEWIGLLSLIDELSNPSRKGALARKNDDDDILFFSLSLSLSIAVPRRHIMYFTYYIHTCANCRHKRERGNKSNSAVQNRHWIESYWITRRSRGYTSIRSRNKLISSSFRHRRALNSSHWTVFFRGMRPFIR